MKQILSICAVVALICAVGAFWKIRGMKPTISDPIVERAVRWQLKKPTGKLTKADLDKVTKLNLNGRRLTHVRGLKKLTQLRSLLLRDNPDLTKAQIDELQKALYKCTIHSDH